MSIRSDTALKSYMRCHDNEPIYRGDLINTILLCIFSPLAAVRTAKIARRTNDLEFQAHLPTTFCNVFAVLCDLTAKCATTTELQLSAPAQGL